MSTELLAATEHLVLRWMTDDDAAALAAYRSDPVQAGSSHGIRRTPSTAPGRIYADCDSRNDRSVALLERIGMRREAALHHKSAWWNTPKPADIWTRPRRPRTSSSRLTQNEPVAGTVSRPVCGS